MIDEGKFHHVGGAAPPIFVTHHYFHRAASLPKLSATWFDHCIGIMNALIIGLGAN